MDLAAKLSLDPFLELKKDTQTKSHVGASSWAGHKLIPLGSPRLEVTSELSPLDKSFKMRTCENSLKRQRLVLLLRDPIEVSLLPSEITIPAWKPLVKRTLLSFNCS